MRKSPDTVESGRQAARAARQTRAPAAVFYFHRQTIRDHDESTFQLQRSAPQARSQSRKKRVSSSGGLSQTSALVARHSGRTKTARPRPLMARNAFSSV